MSERKDTKADRIINGLVVVWLGLWATTVVLALLAIWTTDDRWGQTAAVAFFVGLGALVAGIVGMSVEEDKDKTERGNDNG